MKLGRTVRLTFFFLCLLGVHLNSLGQRYDLVIHATETGLAGNQVNDITQDSLGLLWIATDHGVSRFDGITFKNFTAKHGLAENFCSTVLCDSQGNVWVGHQAGGVSVIKRDSIHHFNEGSGLANNEVHDIIQAKDGKIWVATFGGISIYNGTTWRSITVAEGLSFNNVQALAQYDDESIWAGTYGAGVSVFNKEDVGYLHMGNGLVNNYVTSLVPHDGNMLIGTLGGMSNWNGQQFTSDFKTIGLFTNQINGLVVDDQDRIWLGTFNGAVRMSENQRLSISEINGLPQNEVLEVFCDSESNIWLGTKAGLVRVRNLAFSHFSSTEELDIYPSSLFADSKGNLWAGNEAGGVLEFDSEQFLMAFDDPDINDHQISSIAEDDLGNLWFGTMDFGGLFQFDRKRFFIYSDEFGLADNYINCMVADKDGVLYIGTPNGLSTHDGASFEVVYISDDFATNHITALEVMSDGSVLIGSKNGSVHRLQNEEVTRVEQIRSNSWITDFCEYSNGICVATREDGIWVNVDASTIHITEAQGLPTAGVQLVFQSGNRLYAGCSQGIVQLKLNADTILSKLFSLSEGYLGGACKDAAVSSYEGVHFIGTEKGITRFNPSELNINNHQPQTQLTELQLSYQSVNWNAKGFEVDANGFPKDLILDYTDNNLRFYFRGINHHDPTGVRYKWKLEGLEKEWTPLSAQSEANYPGLAPGNYTFKLIACNENGFCNTQEMQFSFQITPPFWQALWFHISLSLVVVALTFFLIKRRERILIREKHILETTVLERTKELREQKEIVEKQNTHITESIEYASNIQRAILPSAVEMKRAFKDHFVFYRPKDTVGGDFYWVYNKGDISWAAAADCTGHGVAGAFMSMIGSDLLNQIIIEKQLNDPSKVLDEMDKGIKLAFAQSAKEFESDQGMDVSLIRLDRKKNVLEFAGAQRPLYIFNNGTLMELEGDRFSISCAEQRNAESFTKHTIDVKEGMVAYLFSDGIVDQFGGENGKKFMIRRMRDFLSANGHLPIEEQGKNLVRTFDDWKGTEHEQVDDVMLLTIQL
jgi:ligand-binding sensor domain-containing protein/serine phosphatase RsbU (regulator of sigma subunit)